MIRLHSAVDLASSLSVNATLTYLDLSANSLGKDGGEALGASILVNHSLKVLLLSNNRIESRACFTLCMGIIENTTLKKVCLDGNPIGVQGSRALMSVPLCVGDRIAGRC
jgi:Ran GTPase-activating protein (RanGAP) involved in mRNA processing and transport